MLFEGINITDIIDILFVTVLLYILFKWLKRTKSVFVFLGFVILSPVYMLVRILNLRLSVTIMHSFFAVILIAFVIIFQEEIRRIFEQIALFSLHPKHKRKQVQSAVQRQIKIISEAIFNLAQDNIGALIVLPAKDSIRRYIQGGIVLDGFLSSALLNSVFDTHSDGHDGAVIIERGKITRFACHLPLSKNLSILKKGGTRHAAALGLSEMSDALCITVSEERGIVSFCRFGKMEAIESPDKLIELLQNYYDELYPSHKSRKTVTSYFTKNLTEKAAAFLVAVVLWFVVVHESVVVYKSYSTPIHYIGLSDKLYVEKIEPAEIKIILSAPRRNFYFVDKEDIRLELNLFFTSEDQDMDEWKYETIATGSDVRLPEDLNIVNIFPRNIVVYMKKITPP